MDENEKIRTYKDRLRIFLIIYVFSEPYSDAELPKLSRIFQSEQRIQKIDFLLRNTDYLCHELLWFSEVCNFVVFTPVVLMFGKVYPLSFIKLF
jgi:hypothetical protein